jgi:hypothetical protein
MANRVYNKTGTKANLPALNRGEIAYTTDTGEFFIGSSGNNRIIQVNTKNIAIGDSALSSNTTGNNNTALGVSTLQENTTGYNNTAVGYESLTNNTTGHNNTAVGYESLAANTTGDNNTAVGNYALDKNTTATQNVAIGSLVLHGITTGGYNAAVGNGALQYVTAGAQNVAVGRAAGALLSNGLTYMLTSNNSVFIGTDTKGSASDAQTNQIVIGYNAIGNGSNTITLGNSSITKIYAQVTAITALSDARLKEDIEPADIDICLQAVKDLPVTRYKYKNFTGMHVDEHVTGWMADDVLHVFPKAVSASDKYFPELDEQGNPVYEETQDEDGKTISREKMFLMEGVKDVTMTEALPTLWGAVQALLAKVETLESEIVLLKAATVAATEAATEAAFSH